MLHIFLGGFRWEGEGIKKTFYLENSPKYNKLEYAMNVLKSFFFNIFFSAKNSLNI